MKCLLAHAALGQQTHKRYKRHIRWLWGVVRNSLMRGFKVREGRLLGVLAHYVLGTTRPGSEEIDRLVLRLLQDGAEEEPPGCSPCRACGVFLPYGVRADEPCEHCCRMRGTPAQTVALGDYGGGLGALIAAAKYGSWPLPFEVMGTRLGVELLLEISFGGLKPLLVPMPSPWLRRLHRGLDHARIVTKAVAKSTGWKVETGLRRNWAPTQVAATKSMRERGGGGLRTRGRFQKAIQGRGVVLIDDVRTTGTSLQRASRLCHRLGAGCVYAGILAITRENPTNTTPF